jgi:hypothetical protein
MECVEEVMESKPYGIDVSLLPCPSHVGPFSVMVQFCFQLYIFLTSVYLYIFFPFFDTL